MNPEPVWSRFSLDDLRRQLEMIRDDAAVRDQLARHPALKRMVAPSHKPHHNDGVAKSLRIIEQLTPEERRDPSLIDPDRRVQIAKKARVRDIDVFELTHRFGYFAARIWMLTSREFLEEICPSLRKRPERPRRRRDAADAPQAWPSWLPEPVDLARLGVDKAMTPHERDAFRRHWNRLARSGLVPESDVALFSLWNRDLQLWDLTEED